MAKKKIRWTMEKVLSVDITKLDKIEMARAINFASFRINNEIKKLKKFEEETGYHIPALDFIENPGARKIRGQGLFGIENAFQASQVELRRELTRIKYFSSLETSSVIKTQEVISKQRQKMSDILKNEIGIDIDPESIELDDLSDFYELFRLAKDKVAVDDSDQLKAAVWEVYTKYAKTLSLEDFKTIVKDKYDKLYEEEQDRLEEDYKELVRATTKMNKKGRKRKNSSELRDEIL